MKTKNREQLVRGDAKAQGQQGPKIATVRKSRFEQQEMLVRTDAAAETKASIARPKRSPLRYKASDREMGDIFRREMPNRRICWKIVWMSCISGGWAIFLFAEPALGLAQPSNPLLIKILFALSAVLLVPMLLQFGVFRGWRQTV